MQLNTALENIINYVKENNLIPNTPPLVVTVKAATTPLEIEEMITEIHMGISK